MIDLVCIVFQGESGFQKVVETALAAIELQLNQPTNQITVRQTLT